MSFKELLKEKVDYHSKRTNQESRMFKLGRAGKITSYHAASYVINLEHLFFENCNAIREAADRYSSHEKLHVFFMNKWNEEKGHDRWAQADWIKMTEKQIFLEIPIVLAAMRDLTNFLLSKMRNSPLEYVTYIFAAEQFTASLGPVWMELLEKNLGVQRQEVTALSKHIELDGDHATEVLDFIDSLEIDDQTKEKILQFVDDLFEKYNSFFNALAELNGEGKVKPYFTETSTFA